MPIYEYRCSACGHELEALQKISEPRLVTCPECSKDALTKLVSAAGFHLKGSGWYVTDYPRGGAKRDGDTAAKSDAKSETKSEAKAEKSKSGKSESGKSSTTASEKTAS